ncbi:MAG: cadherin-like beta sandwich domain-containing protein, partial [Sphingobacteriales bacterium]
MTTLLPAIKNVITKNQKIFSVAVLLLMLFGISQNLHAQVYYMQNSGKGNVSDADNVIKKIDYTGTGDASIVGGFPNPVLFELDIPNNRAFVYNGFLGSRVINVVNMSNGAVTNTITLPSGIQVSGPSVTSIKYDPINNWVYYITNSGTGVAGELNAIYRSRPDGTSNAALATNIALLPNWLALDIPNNRVFINEAIFSARKMLTFNLGTNTITASPSMSNIINAISYDAATDYLYYITSDNDQLNTGTTNGTTNDALRKMRPDGSGGEIVVKSSVVISPQYLALDAGNNRAYIYNGYYGGSTTIRITTTGIYSVDLTTGATALKLDHAGLQNTPNYLRVMGLYAPARPMVNTTAVTAFSSGSATLGGDVTRSDASVTERGFVYSSSNQTPTIGDGVIQAANGSGTGLFSQPISGLSPSTLYYVRAYATSSAGTSYGSANNFYTLSNDANLSGLGISAGTLNPAFSSATTSFTASVPNSTTSITVTPTKNNVLASIKVNGVTVNSGSPSDAIALNVGSNVITTVVTAQDGGVTKTYTLTVTRAKTPQTISFSLPAKNYGNADFSPGATSSEGLTVSYSSDNSAVATIVNNQVHIVAPGTANITASQAGDATRLAATNVVQSLTVDKGTVTVTANAQTKVYGNNDPVFTYTATGVVGTDAATGSLSRQDPTTNKFVGDYVITQGTLSYGDKYNITYVSANLTITKRPFTIRPVGATKVFADADPNFISFFTDGTSLAAGDATTGNFARSPGENVGAYATLIGQKRVLSMSTYADVTANYSINFVSTNTFVITPKQINVTANPALKAYGTADPVFTYAVPSDVTDATFTGSLSRTAGEEPGQYALTQGTLAINSNYTFNFISDNLTIGPQTLVLTPNAATKVYGNADPVYTFSTNVPIVGNATFTGTPTRAEGKTVGSYAIDGLGTVALDNPRYVLAFAAGGSLTITKRPITLEPVPATKSYGNADPGFPYRFIDGTSVAPGEGMTGTFGRAAGENVGTYALTLGQKSPVNASTGVPTKANYEITFISADLTITPTRLDITATNLSKSFGDEDPSFTYSINQTLVDGDAPTGTLVRALGETRGGYPINQGTLSFGNNYQIFFNGGTFTIGKKTIDVTANALTKTYGTGDPELTYTISESPVGESITGAPGRASGENVGTYAISKGTLSLSDNYVINFTGNDFNINKAQLSYVANPASKPFYTANPTFTGSVTGFANGETIETATTGTLAFSSPALLNSPRGIYPITGSGLSADNYDFIQAAGNSTALSIVASADNTLSALTATKGTLTPVFSPSVLNYGFGVANNVTSFDLSATLNSSFATATINGVPYVSGSTKTLPLAAGGNQFAIVVTAQDETTQTYSLNIYRAYSTNNLLSSLVVNGATISPAFDPDVTSYRASVPHSTGSVSMYGIAADSTAVVKGYDGTVATAENPFTYELSVGEYNYNLIVTSESGANRFYTVLI